MLVTKKKNRLICGWGVNNVGYYVSRCIVIDGKRKTDWTCPYYRKWYEVLRRCVNESRQNLQPTYKGCTVCEEWKYLSNFIKWVDSQPNKDWQNCHLDKDFLILGNKHYSPETVVFVSKKVNTFITDKGNNRGDYMLGVDYIPLSSKKNPYRSMCSSPFGGKSRHIGMFPTELEAHKAWQAKKHEYACQLADLQEDERVAKALRERYAPDKDWTKR